MSESSISEPFVTHGMFTIERYYDAPPSRVFAAHADPAIKRKWFVEGEGWDILSYDCDFRVGGVETSRFRFQGGEVMGNDTVFQDIVPDRRIVLAYTMWAGEKRFSSSLATIEFKPEGQGTRLVFTEHDAFLDGGDETKNREAGTRELLEALDKYLTA